MKARVANGKDKEMIDGGFCGAILDPDQRRSSSLDLNLNPGRFEKLDQNKKEWAR